LTRKGFQRVRATNHEYYRFYLGDKATSIRTKVSHGNSSELHSASPLMRAMQRQMCLSRAELQGFLDCSLSESQYAALLEQQGRLR